MRVYRDTSARMLYRAQLQDLLQMGDHVQVRGHHTREFLNVATEITQPARRVLMIPGRYDNPFLALSESLWMLAGRNDVDSLRPYNKRIIDFSDDGETLYGAYGHRIRAQIDGVVQRLRSDASDRRAYVLIWRPDDIYKQTKDPPCNGAALFKLRDGLLHMTVFNRSNDLHWGLHAVNIPQFSFLQEYLAARLHAQLGTQTHVSQSLHIYDAPHPGFAVTKDMMKAFSEPLQPVPEPKPLFPIGLPRHSDFVESCNDILDTEGVEEDVPFLEFADDFLRAYRDRKEIGRIPLRVFCRHGEDYEDWAMAGDRFLDHLAGRY